MRAALEVLELPDADPALRERLLGVVRDEVQALGDRVQRLVADGATQWGSQWPMEDMLGADLIVAIERRLADVEGLQVGVGPSMARSGCASKALP